MTRDISKSRKLERALQSPAWKCLTALLKLCGWWGHGCFHALKEDHNLSEKLVDLGGDFLRLEQKVHTFCSHPQTQCFTLKVEGGSFLSLHLSRSSTKVTQWPLLLTEVGQAAAMLCVNASCGGTLCFLLLTPLLLCAGRRKVEQTCGRSLHPGRAGRCQAGQEKVGNVLGRSVFPRTLVPLGVHTSLAAATQQCHEFHTQWLSKLVTLAAADQGSRKPEGKSVWDTAERLPSLFGSLKELHLSVSGSCFQPSAALWRLE